MARPREFNREVALKEAMKAFWAKGYAATSTEDLIQAMGIGRQSLYHAFGDKRRLYVEALETYQRETTSGHLKRLNGAISPLAGVRDLLIGLIDEDDRLRTMGCMGVNSVGEFGASDPELRELRTKVGMAINKRLAERLSEGQTNGEIDPTFTPGEAANFIQLTMAGIQLAARGGGGLEELRRMADFATDRLRSH